MPKYYYTIVYAHMDENQTVEGLEAGWGETEITTYEPVETAEQLKEIARTIGTNHGFTRVGILSITEHDEIVGDVEGDDLEQV